MGFVVVDVDVVVWQINKVITGVSYFTHRHTVTEEEEWLTAERMAVSRTRFTAKSIFNRKVRVSSYMYNMLVILLYMYIHNCQSRCIKYDVHVNTVVCLLKCSSVHFWSDTCHTRSFGFIICIKVMFCCAYHRSRTVYQKCQT